MTLMSFIAIIGAGPIGGRHCAQTRRRGRVAEVRLIDSAARIAQGKALDILQSGPVEKFNACGDWFRFTARRCGSQVVVLADSAADDGEYSGDAALALVRQLRGGVTRHSYLPARPTRSDEADDWRVAYCSRQGNRVGAACARVGAARSLRSDRRYVRSRGVAVGGRRAAKTRGGRVGRSHRLRPAADSVIGAHEIAALSSRVTGLWPPGPYALGSATARIVEALCDGSRRRYSCFVEIGRGRVVAMPVELGPGGVRRIIEPALTRLERTALDNALEV